MAKDVFDVELLEKRPGYLTFRARGSLAWPCFRHESGGHRWQRIPPNDKRRRVHTSTVTVAVYGEAKDDKLAIHESELRWNFFRGSGAGGQKRNKTASGVRLTHIPTGILVRIDSGRHLAQNKERALITLMARLESERRKAAKDKLDSVRKKLVGSGMRGDKIRTIRAQEDIVTDHRSGKKIRLRKYLRGEWGDLVAKLA